MRDNPEHTALGHGERGRRRGKAREMGFADSTSSKVSRGERCQATHRQIPQHPWHLPTGNRRFRLLFPATSPCLTTG